MLYSYFVPVTFHKKKNGAETAKGIDNEVNSETNKVADLPVLEVTSQQEETEEDDDMLIAPV